MTDQPSTTSLGVAVFTALTEDRSTMDAALGDDPIRAVCGAVSIGSVLADVVAEERGCSREQLLQALGLQAAQAEVRS